MDARCNRRSRFLLCGTFALLLLVAPFSVTLSWDRYSIADDGTYCHACHGDFRSGSYVSNSDGQTWPNLHNLHRSTMLVGQCDACHIGGDEFPVILGESNGVASPALPPLGCSGCHGRAADGTGNGTEGYGAGLRQQHWIAGETICGDCHQRADLGGLTDANPANFTPAGEDVLPPYYNLLAWPSVPDDPCNPAGSEDYAGAPDGLDNDGDGAYDQADADCNLVASTPGESSGQGLAPMLVDKIPGLLRLTYASPCDATDNTIVHGPLDQVATHVYDGQTCALGISGSYDWAFPTTPGSLFFVVVANNGTVEGSYGLATGGERPDDTTSISCPLPQDLSARCD